MFLQFQESLFLGFQFKGFLEAFLRGFPVTCGGERLSQSAKRIGIAVNHAETIVVVNRFGIVLHSLLQILNSPVIPLSVEVASSNVIVPLCIPVLDTGQGCIMLNDLFKLLMGLRRLSDFQEGDAQRIPGHDVALVFHKGLFQIFNGLAE